MRSSRIRRNSKSRRFEPPLDRIASLLETCGRRFADCHVLAKVDLRLGIDVAVLVDELSASTMNRTSLAESEHSMELIDLLDSAATHRASVPVRRRFFEPE